MAADTGSAILRSTGGVWVNGMEVADSSAVFPGDLLETKPGFIANLDAEGSSILIQGESVVKFSRQFSGFGARKRIRGNFYIDERSRELLKGGTSLQQPNAIRCDRHERDGADCGSQE